MQEKLFKSYSRLSEMHEALIASCASMPEQEINKPMASGKWSVMQVLHHINLSVQLPIDYLQKKMQYPSTLKSNRLASIVRSVVLNAFLRSNLRFKAPISTTALPENSTIGKVQSEWENTMARLSELLETFPTALLHKNVFRHPIVGRINIFQTIQFMTAHIAHHERQITRWRKLQKFQ